MLKVFLEVRVNSRDFLLTFLSFSKLFLFDKELSLSQMSIAIPRIISDYGNAFFLAPSLITGGWILVKDSRRNMRSCRNICCYLLLIGWVLRNSKLNRSNWCFCG
jgi:hypothetical protein